MGTIETEKQSIVRKLKNNFIRLWSVICYKHVYRKSRAVQLTFMTSLMDYHQKQSDLSADFILECTSFMQQHCKISIILTDRLQAMLFWWSVTLGRQHRLPLRTFLQDPSRLCLCLCRMCCGKMLVGATTKAVLSILTGVYRLAGITQGQAWKWLWSNLWILNTLDWEQRDYQLSTLGFCLHPFFFFSSLCFYNSSYDVSPSFVCFCLCWCCWYDKIPRFSLVLKLFFKTFFPVIVNCATQTVLG